MELTVTEGPRALLGGKGAQLATLRQLQLPVPPFVVIPIGSSIDDAGIIEARRTLGDAPVAVRSSAVGEDAGSTSFAGQFDSVLWVESDKQLLDAVAVCRDSVSSERVRVYCQRHGIDPKDIEMAVVIQTMFPAKTAGVMFTADPAAPLSGDLLISAVWGLGEGAVSGHADADTYRVTNEGVESDVATKQLMIVRAEGGGTQECPVPLAQQTQSCLTESQAMAIAEVGRQLEAHFGVPQDVEWAIDEHGELAILQTRPLTGIGPRTGVVYTWDNSNIVESYAGVTTPLTYTFARSAYEVVYRQFCQVMGVPDADIDANASVFKAMIGLVRGRIFYRLDSWYQVLSLLPGAKYNKRFMEQMMGVRKQADLEADTGSAAGKLRIFYLVWRMVKALFGLGRRTEDFKALFSEVYGAYHRKDLDRLPPEELVSTYRTLERQLLLNWKAPIINDFYAMIFFGLLKKSAPEIHNDLLCGEPGMESTLPARESMKMAEGIRANRALSELFTAYDDQGVLDALNAENSPEYDSLREWLAMYLDRYGDRCMEELKLETSTLRDDPTFVVAMLRNYVGRADLNISALEAREQAIRKAAEKQLSPPLGRGWFVRWILRRARRHVRERENLRFARTRVFGLVRRIFLALGTHLERAGRLSHKRDVFYLTVDEILGAIEGTAASVAFLDLVRVRRSEFDRYRTAPSPDDRFETRGGVHLGNVFRDLEPPPVAEGDVLSGLGCAPGVVLDRARVIHSPRSDLNLQGQILVCERTDPGWVPLFPTAGALAVERGSALSHSAIVAREFGIPTVVGVPGLLARVEDGQWLEVDGKAGTIRLDVGEPQDGNAS